MLHEEKNKHRQMMLKYKNIKQRVVLCSFHKGKVELNTPYCVHSRRQESDQEGERETSLKSMKYLG